MTSKRLSISRPGNGQIGGPGLGPGLGPGPEEPRNNKYRIVASTSPSRIEAHAGLFRSLMKGIFDPYVL